jgi:hypothetical protein
VFAACFLSVVNMHSKVTTYDINWSPHSHSPSEMFVLLSFFIGNYAARAMPIDVVSQRLYPRNLHCSFVSQDRSIFNIVWFCAITMFICSWVGIHPDIPAHKRGRFWTFLRRLGLMILALFLPEVIFWRAVVEWEMATKISKLELFKGPLLNNE